MLCVKNRSPVDYSLCRQTVTVYHEAGGAYSKRVLAGVHFERGKTVRINKDGSIEESNFLLVVPCAEQQIFPGDKVLDGVGSDVATREAWAALIPSKVNRLVVVREVSPRYWNGEMVHLEAKG